ncbi:MAG: hypothetical protein ACREP7_21645 [Lysobacter sp.]
MSPGVRNAATRFGAGLARGVVSAATLGNFSKEVLLCFGLDVAASTVGYAIGEKMIERQANSEREKSISARLYEAAWKDGNPFNGSAIAASQNRQANQAMQQRALLSSEQRGIYDSWIQGGYSHDEAMSGVFPAYAASDDRYSSATASGYGGQKPITDSNRPQIRSTDGEYTEIGDRAYVYGRVYERGPNGRGWVLTGYEEGGEQVGNGTDTAATDIHSRSDALGIGVLSIDAAAQAPWSSDTSSTNWMPWSFEAIFARASDNSLMSNPALSYSSTTIQEDQGTGSYTLFSAPPQTAGQGLVTLWDTRQRAAYKNALSQLAIGAEAEIKIAAAAGDADAAVAAATKASLSRNEIRASTQERLSWGGKKLSEAIDISQPPSHYFEKYKQPDVFRTAELVASKAGSSRSSLTNLVRFGKVAGPVSTAFGVVTGVNEWRKAPEAQKPRVASREIGGFLGGAVGSSIGTGLAVAGAGLLLGTPPGWVLIGAGIVGGAIVGYLGSEGGRWAGDATYGTLNKPR